MWMHSPAVATSPGLDCSLISSEAACPRSTLCCEYATGSTFQSPCSWKAIRVVQSHIGDKHERPFNMTETFLLAERPNKFAWYFRERPKRNRFRVFPRSLGAQVTRDASASTKWIGIS